MKKADMLKSFSDVPLVTTQIADAASTTNPEWSPSAGGTMSNDFREELRLSVSAAFPSVVPYHRWGLNE